jgi:hypothetical protein
MLRTLFVRYSPIILLLPTTLAVGWYCIESFNLLYLPANRFYFYYYVLLAAAPLYFVFVPIKPEFSNDLLEIFNKFIENFKRNKWKYMVATLAISILFMEAAGQHISTYTERDRWVLENDLPIIPIDVPVPLRIARGLTHFLSIDLAVPMLGLFSMLIWFSFLVYTYGGENGGGWLVLLVFAFTFINKSFFELLYANFELPAAIFGWIGLFGVWRRRINLGLFFVILSTIWKNTGIFQLAVAVILCAFVIYQDRRAGQGTRQRIDAGFLIFMLGYFALNYWGSFYYMFALRSGPGYVLASDSERIIWFASFFEFVQTLARDYFAVFILGVIGAVVGRMGPFPLLSFGMLIFVRSFSQLSSFYYPLIFLPGLSFFAGFALVRISGYFRNGIMQVVAIILVLSITTYQFIAMSPSYPFGMSRLNSNFDPFIRKLSWRFPKTGIIYQRDISLKPYLIERLGENLNAVIFRNYPENENEFMSELSRPGCKLIIATREHLGLIGITEGDLISMAYSEQPYKLEDQSETWVAYSRDCNAWEYEN